MIPASVHTTRQTATKAQTATPTAKPMMSLLADCVEIAASSPVVA